MGCGSSHPGPGAVYQYGRPPEHGPEDGQGGHTDHKSTPERGRRPRGQDPPTPRGYDHRGSPGQGSVDGNMDTTTNTPQIYKYTFNNSGGFRHKDRGEWENIHVEKAGLQNGLYNKNDDFQQEIGHDGIMNGDVTLPKSHMTKATDARESNFNSMRMDQNGEKENRDNCVTRRMRRSSSVACPGGVEEYPRALSHLVSAPRVVYPRDYFWWPYKRKLMGDFGRMARIDAHALKVQEEAHPDLMTFLSELTRVCENEAEILRAIFRWLSANVAYTHRAGSSGGIDQSALAVLSQRTANCLGFSQTLKYLLNAVDIDCEVIEGTAKGASYLPGYDVMSLLSPEAATRHCWNRVKVNGCWFLCDVTWAAELELKGSEVVLKPAGLREVWFLTDPETFVSTHLPLRYHDGRFRPDPDEQILYTPVDHLQGWHSRAWVSASGTGWGVRALSHPRALITTRQPTLRVTFKCPHVMTFTSVLSDVTTDQRLYGYVMVYVTEAGGDVVTVDVKVPRSGGYVLRIQAVPPLEPHPLSPEKDDTDVVLTYQIDAANVKLQGPFSDNDLSWGVTPAFSNTGCRVVSYCGAVLEAEGGKTSISIQLPSNDLFPHLVEFGALADPQVPLDRCVYGERAGRRATFHLTCPRPGDHLFTLWLKTRPDDDGRLDVSVSFLVHSQEGAAMEEAFPPYPGLWGVQPPALPLGVQVLDLQSSTLQAEAGRCDLSVRVCRGDVHVSHTLEGAGEAPWRSWVYAEQAGDLVRYHLHLPITGRFKFYIAGCEAGETSHRVAALFLIVNPDVYDGPLYPEHENCAWGTRHLFHEYGLTTTQGKSSTLKVKQGKARLQLRLPAVDFPLRAVLTGSGRPQEALEACCVTYRGGEGPQDVTVLAHLPREGYHALRLYEGAEGASLASFLLWGDEPCGQALEGYQGIYGPTPAFHQQGLTIEGSGTSYITTDQDSTCSVTIKVPASAEMHFVVRRNGDDVKGHVSPERRGHNVVVRFRGRDKGFYQLRGYVRGASRRHELMFVYLVENVVDCETWDPYPECRGVWGLNAEALSRDIKVSSSGRAESVLSITAGSTTLNLNHPAEITLKASVKPTDTLPKDTADKCVLVEKTHTGSLMTVAVPVPGYFCLQVAAVKEGMMKYKTVGCFLVESLRASGGDQLSFPAFSNLYAGCRLHEPLTNPLTAHRSCSFRLTVPGALKVRLWDTGRTLRVDLDREEGQGEVWGVTAEVGEVKELWVTAKFPKEDPRGEGGCYRNLLMYEVS